MSDPPELWRLIAYCGHLGKQSNDQLLRRTGYDVTPVQSMALMYLSHCRGDREANQRDLERELHLKPSTVNGIVGRLEEKGYISRRASAQDGRIRLVRLTDTGRGKVGDFCAVLEETERRFTAALSAEEQILLRSLLTRIIANLENEVNHS